MKVEPYLFFNGRCEEALDYYRQALGAEVTLCMRFKDSPNPEACPPGAEDKIMHANVVIGKTTVMVSDGRCEGSPSFQGFALSLSRRTMKPKPNACSPRCPTVARWKCPWPRRSGRRASAWLRIASACRG